MTSPSSSSLSRGQALLMGLLWCVSAYGCWLFTQGSGLLARVQALFTLPAFLTMPLELAVRRAPTVDVPVHQASTVMGLVLALGALALALTLAARADRDTPVTANA